MDKDIQDYVRRDELAAIRGECFTCRREVDASLHQQQIAMHQLAESSRSEREVILVKLDNLSSKVQEVYEVVKNGPAGSLPTRLAVLERDNCYVINQLQAIKQAEESHRKDHTSYLRDVFIQSVPTILTWFGLGLVFLLYLIFSQFGL